LRESGLTEMRRAFLLLLIFTPFSFLFLNSCTTAIRPKPGQGESQQQKLLASGHGDAYLFDIKINRGGKKNSARLDIYRSGDTLSFFARGYLGKGVMKGLIFNDSILVYFPTENEFYSGPLSSLANDSCLNDLDLERVTLQLFQKIPTQVNNIMTHFHLTILKEGGSDWQYRLESRNCGDKIFLKYNKSDKRFILRDIEYQSYNDSFGFEAKRRNYKLNIDVPSDKLSISIPETATRIYP
jgi:hypothetical protein